MQGALTLGSATVEGVANRAIFVAGKGFRGAAGRQSTANGPNTDWVSVATGAHGGKGEGIAGTPRYLAIKANGWGAQASNAVTAAANLALLDNGEGYPNGSHARGAPGNAGGGGTDGNASGGGNNENSGGGGGGGNAQGGLGGRPWNAPLIDSDGRGGAGYNATLAFNRVFPGGGGGSGGTNDATTDAATYENQAISCASVAALCSSGAAGGGVVILRARSLGGSGIIDARGANGYNVANDAGGGGGGGGALVIYSIDGGSASADASGGDGGNAWAGGPPGIANRHGPGGGGGGGFIAYSPNSFGISATLAGGRPGRTTNGVDDTYSSSGYAGGLSTFQTPNTPGILPGAVCSPDLRLAKSDGTTTLTSGGTTTYTLGATNVGNVASAGTVTVVDVLPATLAVANGAVPLSGAQAVNWSCNAASGVITCTSAVSIAAGATSSFAFTANVTGASGTAANNLARVGGGGDPNKPAPNAATTSACIGTDNPLGCAVDADTINAPLLSIVKTDSTDYVRAGGTTTYALTVTNLGTAASSGTIRVVDVLPTGMSYTGTSPFSSGGFTCTYTAGTLSFSCDRSTALGAGASTTISIPAAIAASAPASLTNRSKVGGGGDPGKTTLPDVAAAGACPAPVPPATTASDSATGCASDVDVVRHVDLVLDKDDGQPFMAINGTTTYQFTVSNAGDTASVGTINFRDVLPAPMNWPAALTVGGANSADWACARVSATEASCTSAVSIAAGAQSVFSLIANVGAATSGSQYQNAARIGGGGDPDLLASPSAADVVACTADNNPLGCALDLDTAQNAAQIRLAKSHPDPQAHSPGDTIAFTLAVYNSGGINSGGANTVRVVDVLPTALVYSGAATFTPTGFSCSVAAGPPQVITCNNTNAINAGVTRLITFNLTVAAGATNALVNPAQVGTTGADPQNATLPTAATAATCVGNGVPLIGCAVDAVPLNADLGVVKSERAGTSGAFGAGPLTVAIGTTVQFQLAISNAGPGTVSGAGVSDAIPANFSAPAIVSATAAGGAAGCTTGAFSLVGNALSGTVTTLPSGASCTLVVQAIASTNGNGIVNTATIVAPDGISDANAANDSSSVITNIRALPTVQISKTTLGGVGTFTFAGDNGYAGDSITTVTAGTPVAGATRSLAAAGVATTITEAAPPAGYALTAISCSGLGSGSAGIDIANRRVTLDVAATAPGAAITCTFTNTRQPRLSLQKSLPNGRVAASDQFVLTIAGSGGPVSTTTTGGGTAVTSAPVVLTGTAGSGYTLSEAIAPASTSTLANYTSAISCSNAAGGSSTVLPAGAGTSFAVTPQAGDDITCTLANTALLADLAVTKTDGSGTAVPGSPISYTIVASNAGPSNAPVATVADVVPASITGASWTATYAGGASGPAAGAGNINASVNLPVGGSATFVLSGTVVAGATGTLSNTATVTAGGTVTDPASGNNSATDTDTLTPRADLGIVKDDGRATYTPGAGVTYTIVATNAGPSAVVGATVADTVPAAITGATWTVVYAGGASGPGSGAGNIAASVNLPVGSSATFTLVGTVSAGATGDLVNTATITAPAGTTDPNAGNDSATDTDTRSASADIGVTKTGPGSVGYGGALSYSVVVSNAGPSDANGTTVSDAVPAGITAITASCGTATGGAVCGAVNVAGNTVTSTVTTLPAGGSVTITIDGTAPLSGTSITNSATANPPAGTSDPDGSNNTGSATTTLLQPQLTVTKTASADPFVVGQPASYTVTVTNTGSGPSAGNITLSDTLAAGITLAGATGTNWSCTGTSTLSCTYTGTLAAGTSTTLTLDVTVSAAATSGSNSATASGGGDSTCPAAAHCTGTVTVGVAASADIAVAKTVDNATPNVGEDVTFTVTATNNGPSAASGVQVTDALPSGLAFVSATASQGGYVQGTGVWTVGALANGASATLQITATVLVPGALTNTATKTAGDQFDPNAGNNAGSAMLNAQPSADLQVSKTVDNAVPNLGTDVTFTVTVHNAGPNAASGVVIDDLLPAGLNYVSSSASQGSYDDGAGIWTVGALATNADATLQITASVTLPGDLTNTATVAASDQHDPNPANNSAGVTVNGQSADIQVIKTVDDANPTVGDTITFTITATNNGPSAATGVELTDVLPAELAFVSATASVGSYSVGTGVWTLGNLAATGPGATATLTIVATVIGDGSFTNTAALSALDQTDPNPGNNSSSVTILGVASANLAVVKSGPANAVPGTNVSYTLSVTNAGPSTAVAVSLADPTPAGLTFVSASAPCTGGFPCALGDLASAANVSVTVTFAVPANYAGANLVNTATVTSATGDPDAGDNTSTVTTPVAAQADLAIVKTGPATVNANGAIGYSIVISNAGPSDANGATFSDPVPAGIGAITANCGTATGGAVCGAVNVAGNNVTSTLTALPAGGSVTITINGTAPADATTLDNTATITAPTGVTDPDTGNNASTVTTQVTAVANLAVVKSGPANAVPGTNVSYTLSVTNAGPSTAVAVSLADPTPAGLTFVSASAPCTGGFPCALGDLASAANVSVTVTFAVPANYAGANLVNTATVTSATGDPDAGDNTSTVTTPVTPRADLGIVKDDGRATYTPGAGVTYTIVATNAGPSAVVGATVADTVPAAITGATWTVVYAGGASGPGSGAGNIAASVNLPVGSSATFTLVGTVSAGATGDLVNTATITAPAGTTDPNAGNDSATDTDTRSASADIGVTKTGPGSVGYGGALSYSVVVSNAGPSDANGTTVSDAVPAGITAITASCGTATGGAVCGAVNVAGNTVTSTVTTLPAGGSVTITIDGTAPLSGTSITNSATANPPAGTSDPDGSNNTGSATTTLLQPQLTVTKTASADPFVVGQPASYTVTVTNTGSGPSAGNITLSDTLAAGITLAGATGTNWSCTGTSTLSCTYTGTLAAGTSTTLTLDVTVSAAATSGSNSATASGGGDSTCPAAAHCTGTVTVGVAASADVSIVKTGPATVPSGATITYTLLIANAGPSAADGASYADTVPAAVTAVAASCGAPTGGASCAAPTVAGNAVSGIVPVLPSAGSVTITITGTAPFGAQTLINNANASPPSGVVDPDTGNNSDGTSTTVGNAADIAVTKLVDNTVPNVGDTVTFTITAINNGPNDATGVALTDSLPFGFGFVAANPSQGSYDDATGLWAIGNLADGATVTLTIDASVEQPGALVNTVAVSASDQPDPDTSNNNAGAAVNAGASADIAVAKSVDDPTPNVGSQVTYTITATNNGPNDASGVEITDALPAGVSFVGAVPSQGSYDSGSGVWVVGAITSGSAATLAITVTVDQAGSIMNSAAVTASDQFDPVPANNQGGVTINGQEADLAVTKTVDNAAPNVGDSVVFTVSVHNNGPSDATNVALADVLPAGLAFASATPSQGSYDSAGGVWTVGTLTASGPTSTAILTLAASVTQAGALTNTASVIASDQPDPNPANNSASASLNGSPLADLAVTKSGPATVTPGDNVVYSVAVTNNGPSDAANVVVADPTPAGLAFVGNAGGCVSAYPCALGSVASGSTVTITTTYQVPADYSGANPIVNIASAVSDTPDPDTANNQGSAQTNVGPGNANLALVKSGPAAVASGGAITWTLAISNAGPSPANGAAYTDNLPPGLGAVSASCGGETGGAACVTQPIVAGATVSGTIGTLPSGGAVIVTINAIAPQGPLTLSNAASIAPPAGIVDPDPGDNSDAVDTGVGGPMANLMIVKSGPAQALAGGNVTYTLSVTNNGPDTAAGVTLDDPAPAGTTFVSASLPCQSGFPCALGDLVNGASTIVTVTFAVDATATGNLVNDASVASATPDPDPSDNADSVTTPIVVVASAADLGLAKTGPASVIAGGTITYTIVVTNAGPDAATNVLVSDPTPAGLNFVANSGACTTAYPCAIGSLANGASATITSSYAVPPGYAGANPIVNTATVGSETPDPNGADNTGSATTPVLPSGALADLSVVKTGPATAVPGSNVTYTLTVSNAGPDAAPDVVISDPTPAGLSFVAASAPCSGGFPCALGALASGASAAITVTYHVGAGFSGSIVNIATANSATVPDPDPDNNSGTETTVVAGAPPGQPTQVPVDARWMLLLMALLLTLAGATRMRRRH